MKILVTGANGYLASWLIRALLDDDHTVFGLSRCVRGVEHSEYHHILVDLATEGWDHNLPQEPVDCIVHLAQSLRYRDFPAGVRDMIAINVASTSSLLTWAQQVGVKKFIFSSTGNVYKPQTGMLDEESPCFPVSFYGTTKLCAELICQQFSSFFEIDIFRIFSLYGPKQENMLIPKLIETIRKKDKVFLASGKGLVLTPIYVEDAVKVLLNCIYTQLGIGTHLFNLAGDEVLNLDEITFEIAKVLDVARDTVIIDEDPSELLGSNRKMKKMFGKIEMSRFSTRIQGILAS